MRLVDIDSLKGCAIIRPTSSEEIAHIQACKGCIAHKDIPTAYDVEAVVAELMKLRERDKFGMCYKADEVLSCTMETSCRSCYEEIVREIVRGKE